MSIEPSCDKVIELKLPELEVDGDHLPRQRKLGSDGRGSEGAGGTWGGNRERVKEAPPRGIARLG